MKEQHEAGAGVFACDGHLIFSNVSSEQLFGRTSSTIYTAVIPGNLEAPRGDDGVLRNSNLFITVWGQIVADGRFRDYDWTVKLEVDTLLVAPRLRGLLRRHCDPKACGPMSLRSSGKVLPGALEVLSLAAMKYFAGTGERCASLIEHSAMSESQYLTACLDSLMIAAKEEPRLLRTLDEESCRTQCDGEHAAFHPLTAWPRQKRCVEQSSHRVVQSKPQPKHLADLSLFCFAVVVPLSYEAVLVAAQYVEGVGVFSCDDYLLFSNVSAEVLFAPGIHPARWPSSGPAVKALPGNLQEDCGRQACSSLGPGMLAKVWEEIVHDSRSRRHDWSVKLDPDTVFVPARLRELLWSHCPQSGDACEPLYVEGVESDRRGPIKAMSSAAVARYSERSECCAKPTGGGVGLDPFLRCLNLAEIQSVQMPKLLSNQGADRQANTCDAEHAAYHPFRMWKDYAACMQHAGYYVRSGPPAEVAWTFDAAPSAPTLFCFAVVLHSTSEPYLLLHQRKSGVGIFSCNGHLIISDALLNDVFGSDASGVRIVTIRAKSFSPQASEGTVALDSSASIQAWHQIFKDGRYRHNDWTIKLDTDAAFVPQRVRQLLWHRCQGEECAPMYLSNFGSDLRGAVEILSRQGMEKYAAGVDRCLVEIDYSGKDEDWYLSHCLDLLRVHKVEGPLLFSNWHDHRSKCDTMHAVFHPFSDWTSYYGCLCETGLDTADCRQMLSPGAARKSTTSTTKSTTTASASTTPSTTTAQSTTTEPRTNTTTSTRHAELVIMSDARGESGGDQDHHRPGAPPPTAENGHRRGGGGGSDGRGGAGADASDDGVAAAGAEGQHHRQHPAQAHGSGLPLRLPKQGGGRSGGSVLFASGVSVGTAMLAISACLAASWHFRKTRMLKLEAFAPSPVPTSPSRAEAGEVKMLESAPRADSGVNVSGFDAAAPQESPIGPRTGLPATRDSPPTTRDEPPPTDRRTLVAAREEPAE